MSAAAAGLACSAAGPYRGLPAQACALTVHPASVLSAGKTLLTNPIGGALNLVGGTTAQLALSVVGASMLGAAGFVLREPATVISTTTEPQLLSSWFSASYWEMSAIAVAMFCGCSGRCPPGGCRGVSLTPAAPRRTAVST